MKRFSIFLITLSLLFLGCSSPEGGKAPVTPATTPSKPTPTPAQTPAEQSTGSDLGIEDIQKELEELEKMLSELEELENVTFEV
jgi:hypothetical protein